MQEKKKKARQQTPTPVDSDSEDSDKGSPMRMQAKSATSSQGGIVAKGRGMGSVTSAKSGTEGMGGLSERWQLTEEAARRRAEEAKIIEEVSKVQRF